MRALDGQDIITVWERGRRASDHVRALLLAELAGVPRGRALELPLGSRDAMLAELRVATYGEQAPAFVTCPACGEGLEFVVDFTKVLALARPLDDESIELERDGVRVRVRLPATHDLLALVGLEQARAALLERVVVVAEREGRRLAASDLPPELVSAIELAIEERDPISDIRFGQTCPTCQHRFVAPFDVARFCWHELDVDARRTLQEIDVLARTYGWSERELLEMSRTRRLTYLELCGS